jgi:hypothetical protein
VALSMGWRCRWGVAGTLARLAPARLLETGVGAVDLGTVLDRIDRLAAAVTAAVPRLHLVGNLVRVGAIGLGDAAGVDLCLVRQKHIPCRNSVTSVTLLSRPIGL